MQSTNLIFYCIEFSHVDASSSSCSHAIQSLPLQICFSFMTIHNIIGTPKDPQHFLCHILSCYLRGLLSTSILSVTFSWKNMGLVYHCPLLCEMMFLLLSLEWSFTSSIFLYHHCYPSIDVCFDWAGKLIFMNIPSAVIMQE